MKKLFFILFLFPCFCFGQNLVPNPSFEDTIFCLDPEGWLNYSDESPDYFNSCSNDWIPAFGVPFNWGGYQPAASGQAYWALSAYYPIIPDGRELIGRDLSVSLSIGTKYFVSFQASLSIESWVSSSYACNNLGALFSTTPYSFTSPAPVANFAHVYTNTIITDTMNWTRVFGSFVADSAYTNITIGNFFDDANTDTLKMVTGTPAFIFAYYYIDDVCVSTDSTFCADYSYTGVQDVEPPSSLSIYPNPTTGKFTVANATEQIQVFDLFGRLLLRSNKPEIDMSNYPAGLYIWSIGSERGKLVLE